VRLERLTPGSHAPHRLEGSVLARDLVVAGERKIIKKNIYKKIKEE